MQIHNLQPNNKSKSRKRIGRGGKKGTYCGKGVKGQKCRAGRKFQPAIREFIKRYPKLRGYRVNPIGKPQVTLNMSFLDKHFKAGDKVNPKVLLEMKLIDMMKNRVPRVKILANGDIKKKLTISGCFISVTAKEKIEKAGGIVTI